MVKPLIQEDEEEESQALIEPDEPAVPTDIATPLPPAPPTETKFNKSMRALIERSKTQQATVIPDGTEDEKDRQGILTNAVTEVKDIFVGLTVATLTMLYRNIVQPAWEITTNVGWLGDAFNDIPKMGGYVAENAAGIVKATDEIFVTGTLNAIEKWHNPYRAIHNRPVESLLDLSLLGGIIGGIARRFAARAGKNLGVRAAAGAAAPLPDTAAKLAAEVNASLKNFDLNRFADLMSGGPVKVAAELLKKAGTGIDRKFPKVGKAARTVATALQLDKAARFVHKAQGAAARRMQAAGTKIAIEKLRQITGMAKDELRWAAAEALSLTTIAALSAEAAATLSPAAKMMHQIAVAAVGDLQRQGFKATAKTAQSVKAYKNLVTELEDLFLGTGTLAERQAARAESFRFLAETIDKELKKQKKTLFDESGLPGEFAKGYLSEEFAKAAIDPTTIPKSQITDALREEFERLGVDFTYFPIYQKAAHTDLWERAMVRGEGAGIVGDPRMLRTAENIPSLNELLNSGNFITDLDAVAFQFASHRLHALMLRDVLDQVIKSPYARQVKNVQEVKWAEGEAAINPSYFKKITNGMIKGEEFILSRLRAMGDTDFTPLSMLRLSKDDLRQLVIMATKHTDDAARALESVGEFYAVPLGMAKALDSAFGGARAHWLFELVWDTPMSIWKTFVLPLRPGWYVINYVGNIVLSMLSGSNPFKKINKHHSQLIPEEVKTGLFGEMDKLARQLAPKLQKLGPLQRFQYWLQRKADTFGQAQNMIEGMFRKNVFFDEVTKQARKQKMLETGKKFYKLSDEEITAALKNPQFTERALQQVNDALFDYLTLHPFERAVARRVFPFWTFNRNLFLLVGRALGRAARHPALMILLHRWSQYAIDMMGDDEMPPWAQFMLPIGIAADGGMIGVDLKSWIPMLGEGLDITRIANLAPALKITWERIAGLNAFTKKPFRTGEPAFFFTGDTATYAGNNRWTFERPVPPILEHIARQFPQYNLIRDVVHPRLQRDDGTLLDPKPILGPDGKPVLEKHWLEAIGRFFGISYRKVDAQKYRMQRIQQRATVLRELLKQLRNPRLFRDPEEREAAMRALREAIRETPMMGV